MVDYLVEWAIEDAQYKTADLDKRGLFPLEEARKILNDFEGFQLGEFLTTDDGEHYREGDVTFAALCSLENFEEFFSIVKDKEWKNNPGSSKIEALAERYEEELLPWLQTMILDNNFPEECMGR